jgi:hypothetical protein
MYESWANIIEKQGEHLVSSNRSPFTLEDKDLFGLATRAVDVFC